MTFACMIAPVLFAHAVVLTSCAGAASQKAMMRNSQEQQVTIKNEGSFSRYSAIGQHQPEAIMRTEASLLSLNVPYVAVGEPGSHATDEGENRGFQTYVTIDECMEACDKDVGAKCKHFTACPGQEPPKCYLQTGTSRVADVTDASDNCQMYFPPEAGTQAAAPVQCAQNEDDICKCSGKVFYGRKFMTGTPGNGAMTTFGEMGKSAYKEKTIDGEVKCSHAEFGGDPLPGVLKWCYCVAVSTEDPKVATGKEEAPKVAGPVGDATDDEEEAAPTVASETNASIGNATAGNATNASKQETAPPVSEHPLFSDLTTLGLIGGGYVLLVAFFVLKPTPDA